MNLRGYSLQKEHSVFPTCIMEFDLSDSRDQIEVLLEEIEKSNFSSHELIANGISSFYSGERILDHERLKSLRSTIELCIKDYVQKTGLDDLFIANSWWNKLGAGDFVEPHRHYASIVSGAFYPKVYSGSSSIYFNSPISIYKMAELYKNPITEYSVQKIALPAKQYHMYLFPSWLEHGVLTNETDNRIVVSFNTDRCRQD